MQCYTDLTPPTAVTHAVSLPLLTSEANNLVVAKTSLLQVFEVRAVPAGHQSSSNGTASSTSALDDSISSQKTDQLSKLFLIGECHLAGTITSLARVKALNTKSGGEALLVSLKDAKISLVEWDPEAYALSTISIHYYEGDELQGAPWSADLSDGQCYLTADPSSRCASLRFGNRNLAILPFRQVGDDLVEGDYDLDFDQPMEDVSAKEQQPSNAKSEIPQTPYSASFVLPFTALDPTLTNIIHHAFLYEYREPTFGILSSTKAPSASLLHERKDVVNYTVFTLDLEQRASTTLLSVSKLPYDLLQIVPLPPPVGGALLIGGNEIIHVDQAGKTNAVALNEFARKSSSFPMTDQSELRLRLEGCVVAPLELDRGNAVVILNTGQVAILSFRLDGRAVSGLSLHLVGHEYVGSMVPASASCVADLGKGKLFVGSEECDAALLSWSRRSPQLTRKRSQVEMLPDDADISLDEEEVEDYDDDLYATGSLATKQEPDGPQSPLSSNSYFFKFHDVLPNLGPMRDVAMSAPPRVSEEGRLPKEETLPTTLNLVAASGRLKAGALVIMSELIDPEVHRTMKMSDVRAIWSVRAKKQVPKPLHPKSRQLDVTDEGAIKSDPDQFLIVSRISDKGNEESAVYTIDGTDLEETAKSEFEPDAGGTVSVGSMAGGTRIVQVLKGEVRSYDADLGLAQIFPLSDEDLDTEVKAVAASFADPYLFVLRDDGSFVLLECDRTGDLDEVERTGRCMQAGWISGCVYKSTFRHDRGSLFLLNRDGGLEAFELPNLATPVFVAEGLSFLPPTLSSDYAPRRNMSKAEVVEILVADLGEGTLACPFLMVRTMTGDLSIYQPYRFSVSEPSQSFLADLRWFKVSQPKLTKHTEHESDKRPQESMLRTFKDVGGHSTVVQTGHTPRLILKQNSSNPRVLRLRGTDVQSFTSFNTAQCERGFAYLGSDGTLKQCRLAPQTRYGDIGWAVRKIELGYEVHALEYYFPKDIFVLGSSRYSEFKPPEDEHRWEWNKEEIGLRPTSECGSVELFYLPTKTVVQSYQLDEDELVMCIKAVELETSEITHERKSLVCVGTATARGEDLPTKGCIYVFEIITVVPEPGQPGTDRKLKLIAREEVRGAVTCISSIGSEGFLLMSQGQKCMVRGLKEDGSLLPVAFIDTECYVTVAKELKGSGMVLLGDLAKGIWFAGYTEEPYRMLVFGKGRSRLEVICAEFLPYQKQLFIVVADASCNLHVLQFDPEHPKSLSGQRLLHKSTFHTGHFPTTMTLLPTTLATSDKPLEDGAEKMLIDGAEPFAAPQQILVTTQSGSLSLITPVDEQTYRRLSALQAHLVGILDHPCGLNPRAYRAAESEGFGSRGVVDGSILMRWSELGSHRLAEVCAKVGMDEWTFRADMELIGGGGLGYL